MKQMYTAGPKSLRIDVDAMIATGDLCGALVRACEAGYDVPEPPQTHVERLAALRAAGEHVAASEYANQHAEIIDAQRRAHVMWLGRRAWAALPSAIELAEAAKVKAAADQRTAAVERRTLEILEAAEADARAKRLNEARKRAEKEL